MNISRRLVVSIFILLIILFVGMLNWPFVLNEIIMPVSLVVWLFLRILVLSIDQQYYWVGLVLGVFVFLFRLLPQEQSVFPSDDYFIGNETINAIGTWRRLFIPDESVAMDKAMLKQDLSRMVVSLYAIKLHTPPDYKLRDALRNGEFDLPESIHSYLFPKETQKKKRSFIGRMQSVWNASRLCIYRLTGQEKADHYRMIEEILSFLETSLEMKNDEGKFNPNQY